MAVSVGSLFAKVGLLGCLRGAPGHPFWLRAILFPVRRPSLVAERRVREGASSSPGVAWDRAVGHAGTGSEPFLDCVVKSKPWPGSRGARGNRPEAIPR